MVSLHSSLLQRANATSRRSTEETSQTASLVFMEKLKRRQYPLGRITELVIGKDGLVREVKLVMIERGDKKYYTNRAIQCLYPMEVRARRIDADYSDKPSLFGDYISSSGDLWTTSSATEEC